MLRTGGIEVCALFGLLYRFMDRCLSCAAAEPMGHRVRNYRLYDRWSSTGAIYNGSALMHRSVMTELQAKLASLSIFKELDATQLASVARRVQWFSVVRGWTLFSEGDPADDMFVLLSGCVGVFKRNAKGDLELVAQTESGKTIGEMALLSNERRSATIIALCNTELAGLDKQLFEELASRSPNMMRDIAEVVAMRLRNELRSRSASSLRGNASVAIDGGAADDSVERKLAGILYADVCGYSRLMGEDEEAHSGLYLHIAELSTAS